MEDRNRGRKYDEKIWWKETNKIWWKKLMDWVKDREITHQVPSQAKTDLTCERWSISSLNNGAEQ